MSIILERRTDTPAPSLRSWRFPRFATFAAIIALGGLLVLLYPSTAAWVSQYNQSQLITSYTGEVGTLASNQQAEAIRDAHAYNLALTGGASVAANQNVPMADSTGGASQFDYSHLLRIDETGLMGRLRVPAIRLDLPIYHGTDDDTLEQGVGHLEGTALPVGGVGTHSVLTAHRGLASAELFDNLDAVTVGDTFTIEVFGEVLTYRVMNTRVVQPDQTESLRPQFGEDLVTLVTCTPLGINSHRILVTGERVTPTPIEAIENAGAVPDIPGFPWWAVGLGGGVLLLSAYVWRMGRTEEAVIPEK